MHSYLFCIQTTQYIEKIIISKSSTFSFFYFYVISQCERCEQKLTKDRCYSRDTELRKCIYAKINNKCRYFCAE